jgi:nuclear pore complex protein Nup98-Nup96
VQDYMQNRKTAPQTAFGGTGAFGQPSTTSAFGGNTQQNTFGGSSSFGQPSNNAQPTSIFGGTSTFGQPQNQQQQPNAFGGSSGAFGQPQQPQQQQNAPNAFGSSPSIFGQPKPAATNAFGGNTPSAFGGGGTGMFGCKFDLFSSLSTAL